MLKSVFVITALIFGLAAQATSFKQEYLTCFGHPESTWGGYTVHLKKLSNGKVYGVMLKTKIFTKDTYTTPFEVKVTKNANKTTTYSNEMLGLEFTTFIDSYSGSLAAEAYLRSYIGPSELLCDEMDAKEFYFWHVDPKRNDRIKLENINQLYLMKADI